MARYPRALDAEFPLTPHYQGSVVLPVTRSRCPEQIRGLWAGELRLVPKELQRVELMAKVFESLLV
jgi:hypothetical protein